MAVTRNRTTRGQALLVRVTVAGGLRRPFLGIGERKRPIPRKACSGAGQGRPQLCAGRVDRQETLTFPCSPAGNDRPCLPDPFATTGPRCNGALSFPSARCSSVRPRQCLGDQPTFGYSGQVQDSSAPGQRSLCSVSQKASPLEQNVIALTVGPQTSRTAAGSALKRVAPASRALTPDPTSTSMERPCLTMPWTFSAKPTVTAVHRLETMPGKWGAALIRPSRAISLRPAAPTPDGEKGATALPPFKQEFFYSESRFFAASRLSSRRFAFSSLCASTRIAPCLMRLRDGHKNRIL